MHSLSRKRFALIVDDSSDSVIPLSILLENIGWETEIAFDGIEALRKAHRSEPELVLLDINMPKLDGIGTCSAIKVQPWAKKTRIIAITGNQSADIYTHIKKDGFDAVFLKPIDFKELSDLLATYTED